MSVPWHPYFGTIKGQGLTPSLLTVGPRDELDP